MTAGATASDPRPLLVYDGRCRFCVRQATRLSRWSGGRVRLESFRDPGVIARHPGLTPAACEAALQLVLPEGGIVSGAEAVARTLALRPGLGALARLSSVPPLGALLGLGYRLVARNRFRLSGEACSDDACRLHS